ncbi:uncharacterized protein LOC125766239 [Anopheles funestus]|uniref:uncharacterized protein LOC125766239 n=1 Tax=Anopheles funestus TaxID=62324 RepID=UPI0020C6D3CE|nr:uncharacterized protein LOC125766239 [Anopheles funestus]
MGSNYDLKQLKPLIRSMVLSHRNKTVSIQELERDFKDIEGFPIPYTMLGYASVFDLLHAMPDIVRMNTENGIPVVTYVSSPATEHVEHLIQRNANRRRGNGGRNMQAKYPPNEYHFRTKVLKSPRHGLNFNTKMKVLPPRFSNAGKATFATVTKNETTTKHNEEKIRSPPRRQPTTEDSSGNLVETCEHSDGNAMSWKPYCDMWDSVNMIDLPPNVMTLSHTIPKVDVSHYFAEKADTIVRVLHVLNPNRIWLRSVLQDQTMEQLHTEIQDCYQLIQRNEWCLEANKVQYGLYCAAQIDHIWHRVKIVGPLMGNHVKIFFIDMGLIELVDYKCMKLLFNAFSVIPAQAIRASLACLIPRDNAWTRAESESLSAMITPGKQVLTAYTLNVNHKLGILDIVLKDVNMNRTSINEYFATVTKARWTGEIYLSQDPNVYRNKRRSFNEKYPSFYCIEEGHFPTIGELRHFVARNFDYEELYTRLPHFEKNGVVEKISQATNEQMVKLYGIVSATDQEELECILQGRDT